MTRIRCWLARREKFNVDRSEANWNWLRIHTPPARQPPSRYAYMKRIMCAWNASPMLFGKKGRVFFSLGAHSSRRRIILINAFNIRKRRSRQVEEVGEEANFPRARWNQSSTPPQFTLRFFCVFCFILFRFVLLSTLQQGKNSTRLRS